MQFTTTLILLITAITGASAAAIDARSNAPLPPDYADLDNAPPRADQVEGVICDVAQFSKTKQIAFTGRSQSGGAYQHLNGIDGNAVQSAGPGLCTRISCGYDLGVYFCNDNDHTIEVPWSTLAKYTNDIGMVCGGGVHLPSNTGQDPNGRDYFDFRKNKETNGQKFSADNWNVYVNGDKC